jgi:hypothetical protein
VTTLRGELIGSDTVIAAGIEARSTSALCRKLVEAEYAPATRLELFRGLTVALRVCAIGAAAELETDGAGFRPTRRAGRTPLVRPMDAPATLATPALENRGVRSSGGYRVSRLDLKWRGHALHDRAGRLLLRIVPDAKWPGMWRVEHPDDRLSDLMSKTRARDAASLLACERAPAAVPHEAAA